MTRTLRFYYDRVRGELVTSPGRILAALSDRAAPVNVVHWKNTDGWTKAVHGAVEYIQARLLAGFWRYATTISWALLACFLIWWLPLGQRAVMEEAFWVVLTLPLIVGFLAFFGCTRCLVLLRRIRLFVARVMESRPILSCDRILPPASLLAEVETPKLKRLPALLSLVMLLLVVTVGNIAVPAPGTKILVHQKDGAAVVHKKPVRLTLGDWWELVPRHVVGETYGYIYFNEKSAKIMVFAVKYDVSNDNNHAASEIHQKMASWALNLGQYWSSLARGEVPPGLSPEEEMEHYEKILGDSQILNIFKKQIQDAADAVLGERIISLEVEVTVVGLNDYQKKMRRYY